MLGLFPVLGSERRQRDVGDARVSFKDKEMLKLSGRRQQSAAVCEENAQEKLVFSLSNYASSGAKPAHKNVAFKEKSVRKIPSQHPLSYSASAFAWTHTGKQQIKKNRGKETT